jgi:HEAT repeat protein
LPSDPPGSNPDEQSRLDRLIRTIGDNGKPKREQAIVELRPFLQSNDPRVRFEAAAMLYCIKDRSGYSTLLEILRNPNPVLRSGGIDLRILAAGTFARYRERWAAEALLDQYEQTRLLDIGPPILELRLKGMAPYLHEWLNQRVSPTILEGLAVLEPRENELLFKRVSENDQQTPRQRAAAVFGLAMTGDEASLERLIAVATNAKEALPGNDYDAYLAERHAATYLTNFRGERVVKVFEAMLTGNNKNSPRSVALVYLRYRYPENQPSREIIKAGLQPGGASLGWDYTLLLQLVRLSGDPELLAIGHKTDYFTSFRELDVRAGWSNAWIGDYLPDWEGDW